MTDRGKLAWLWALVLLVPLMVAGVGALSGMPGEGYLAVMAWFALPFALLALIATFRGMRRGGWLEAGIAGALVTFAFWGIFILTLARREPSRTHDPNVGMALLMLASPVIVGVVMLVVRLRMRTPHPEADVFD